VAFSAPLVGAPGGATVEVAAAPTAGLTSVTLRSPAELAAIESDWDSLYRRSPTATPFLAYGWISSYARTYGSATSLRVVCVRDRVDRLVAAAPLWLARRPGWSVLSPVAAELSDFTDVLIDPAVPGAAAQLVEGLLQLPGWDLLDAPEVPPDAALRSVAAQWPGQLSVQQASTCLELPVRPVDELVESLSARHRKSRRRALRRIDGLDLRSQAVPPEPEPIARAVGELLDLHVRQWAGRQINPTHASRRFRSHLTAAAQRLIPSGQAMLLRFTLDGSVVAVSMNLLTDDLIGGYLYGVDPALREQVDAQVLMLRTRLEVGVDRGARRLSLLRGQEEPKLRWEPTARPNQRLVLLRPRSNRAVLGAVAVLLRAAAEEQARRSARAVRLGTWLQQQQRSVAARREPDPGPTR
jgi:CelD/BcsL family acetyltransferase involved in cellulose biosynthesis